MCFILSIQGLIQHNIALFVSVTALIFTIINVCINTKNIRLKIVTDVLVGFSGNPKSSKAFYKIEYAKFKYEDFHGKPDEENVDLLLRYFSVIAIAWERGLVKMEDIQPAVYHICRIMGNSEIKKYLETHSLVIPQLNPSLDYSKHPFAVLQKLYTKINEKNKESPRKKIKCKLV
ncbi:hypothetical protein FACS189483_03420 [Spirochaetia bacterium]|nr:hypothetical protein FACS189483_03420 [Spirochaetia bacterium]